MNRKVKLLVSFALAGAFLSGCKEKGEDDLKPLDNIIVGKTDYPGCYYEDYEPDLIITADLDLSDPINIQSGNGFEYLGNGGLALSKYNDYENETIYKWLTTSLVGSESVARVSNNDTISRIFERGDTLGISSNWVDASFCCHPDFAAMTYDYGSDLVTHAYNANLTGKYVGFRSFSEHEHPVYTWIHFSVINLDTLIIHEAFSTPYIE